MKVRKQLFLFLFLCVAAFILLCSGVTAYWMDTRVKSNSIQFGTNTIIAKEEFEPLSVGKVTVKTPRAVNQGNAPCYVRGYVTLSDSRAAGYIEYHTDSGPGMGGSGWEKSEEDGYYYYTDRLYPSEETEALFTGIKLLEDLPPELKEVSVDIYFESVQAEGADSAQEAFGKIRA